MGCWDDGGFSEAKVSYKDGVFHLFYGGAKLHPTRICTKESIGYAYSFDGVNFVKHPDNPIAIREKGPDAAAFAEAHSYCEHPLVYLYHTLRYNSREGDEDIGVQVLATQRPFRLRMPLIVDANLAAGQTTGLADCPPVNCEHVTGLAVSAACKYGPKAARSIRLCVRTSCDGLEYDSEDLLSFEPASRPGQEVRQTFQFNPKAMFVKVIVENPDAAAGISGLNVFATLVG